MRNSCQSLIPSPAEDVGKKTSERTDMTTIKNNPKINYRLLAEYDRLVAASKGVVRVTQGVDYNLAHPIRIQGQAYRCPSHRKKTERSQKTPDHQQRSVTHSTRLRIIP